MECTFSEEYCGTEKLGMWCLKISNSRVGKERSRRE